MKNYCYLLYLFAILIFMSCNEFENEDYETDKEIFADIYLKLEETAYLMTESINQLNDIKLVHSSIQRSMLFGLDENLRFNEIFDVKASKIIGDDLKRKLLDSNSIFQLGMNQKSTNGEELKSFLLDNDLQIYWPYSEYWDGNSRPVITFLPEDVSQLANFGFKPIFDENDLFIGIDTIVVDEQFAIENPVWIINRNNIPYCELPDFSQGQLSHNKVAFAQKNYDLNMKSISNNNMDISGKTFRVQIGWIKCTYQWDAWWNGGPEFVSQWIGLESNDSLDYMDKVYTHLTRRDVSRGRWIRLYQTTNNEWLPEELYNFFVFYEEDNTWPRENLKGDLNVKEGITLKYDLPFGNKNEILKESVWSRSAFYNETKGINDPNASFRDGWKLFSNNNTWWTMPYVISQN